MVDEEVQLNRVSCLKEKIKRTEKTIDSIGLGAICLAVFLFFSSSWMAANWFSYDIVEVKTRQESYEYPVKEVSTYECYTTTYGDCYHAKGCGSLWNSSHKTTVYEAKSRGYRDCSKCEPRVKTTLVLYETRYKQVEYETTTTKEPQFLVCVCSVGIVIALYYIITTPAKASLRKDRAELKTLQERAE